MKNAEKPRGIPKKVILTKGKNAKTFESLTAAAKFLDCQPSRLSYALSNCVKGWTIVLADSGTAKNITDQL